MSKSYSELAIFHSKTSLIDIHADIGMPCRVVSKKEVPYKSTCIKFYKITANYPEIFQISRHIVVFLFNNILYRADICCAASGLDGCAWACALDSFVLAIFILSLFCLSITASNSLWSLSPSLFLFFRYLIK